MKTMTMTTLATFAAMTSFAGVLFQEDFSHYRDEAPGVTKRAGITVSNEPIGRRFASLDVQVEKDVDIFRAPKALPAGNSFDVLCAFSLAASNSAFEVVFTAAGGKTLVVPVSGFKGWQRLALKAAAGKLALSITEKNRFVKVKTFDIPAELKTVNFRVKAGGLVCLTGVVVRTPEPLPTNAALAQYPAMMSALQKLDGPWPAADETTVLTSDGTPLDLANKSYSFVPGATGVVGSVELTWDSGRVQAFPVSVGDEKFGSAIPSYSFPQLGLKPKEQWTGRDAVVYFGANGSLARLFVRPAIKNFASYRALCDKGVDIVREWDDLPPASTHVTTVEMRETDEAGAAQLWVDGSFVTTVAPPRADRDAKKVVKATLALNKGVAYRVNAVDRESLQLWARPKAKAFADAVIKDKIDGCAKPWNSADVGIAHYAQRGFSMDADGYTMRSPLDGYPGEVHFRVPAAPYAKAEILFCLDDDPLKIPYMKTRLAHYSMRFGTGCTEIEDSVFDLRGGMPANVREVGRIYRGPSGTMWYPIYRAEIELPIGRCLDFAAGDFIDIEFLGPTEENLQQSDNTQKPREDLSSSITLLGVKLRKLNVLPELAQASPGNVFTADEKEKKTTVKLTALVDNAKGVLRFGDVEKQYALAKKGDMFVYTWHFNDAEVGWYEVPVVIDDGTASIRHDLVYCVTPEAGRDATAEESPFGTWWFSVHGSPGDPDLGGPLVQKAGIRKISWNHALKAEHFKKYDCTSAGFIYAPRFGQFDETTGRFKPGKLKKDGKTVDVDGEELVVAAMKDAIAKKPFVDHIMVWHESAPQCGIPEEILGLAAPTNDVAREKSLAAYVNEVGRICRKHFPNLKIQLGNSNAGIGAPTVPMRGGANPDYYDILGMEIPSQTIAPERPHDFGFLGQNVAKAAAKKLCGRDIPTGGCFEFIYRAERDMGARREDVQAEYHARDLLISLMNSYTLTAPGLLFDCRNAYCNTLWGVAGIVHRSPYVYPKKSYLAYAVMTKVMDGVKFVREIPTGSSTVYAAEFRRKDGRYATAFWCARGEADLVCDMSGELWTMYGRRSSVGGWFSDAKFTCSCAPAYVISEKPCESVEIAARRFADDALLAAQGTKAAEFSTANCTVAPDPEMESTHHEFLPYLKPGAFTARDVDDPEEGKCLEITLDTSAPTPQPVTEFVTEYTTVRFREPVAVAGVTGLLGLRVKGNSNWGQIRFEFEDADGEVFKGISTGKSWGCDVYDWPGYTALSFDGWGDVYQYTDANDYDLIISPGTRFEQWVSSNGGDKRIAWPIKLRAVTVCVNRFKPTILGFTPTENPSIRLKSVWTAPAKADSLLRTSVEAPPFTVTSDRPVEVKGCFKLYQNDKEIVAEVPAPANTLRVPRRFLKNPNGRKTATLDYDGSRWTLLVDEQRDVDFLKRALRVPAGTDLSIYPKRALPAQPDAKPITRPIQYWTPDDWNAWVGDVVLANWKGRVHVFYLFDRRHHNSKAGMGGHYFAHLSSADLRNWTEHPDAVPSTERWEYIGTGMPFVDGDRMHLFYGLHTTRHAQPFETTDPQQAAFLAASGREGEFTFGELNGYPMGGTYATTSDGIHFTKSSLLVTSDQNPSPYRMADGRIGMPRSAFDPKVSGLWASDRLGGWKFVEDKIPTRGDCPCPFIWNGWDYVIQGFVGMAGKAAKGAADWQDWVLSGDDIYDGLAVPMVVPFGDNRRLIVGWLNHVNGWGGWLCFRELIQYPDGKLGMKWVPEISAPVKPLVYDCSPGKPLAVRFRNEKGDELEFSVDPENARAQFADVKDGKAPRVNTLSENANLAPNDYRKRYRDRPSLAENLAIGKIRGLDKPFQTRLNVYYDDKEAITLFDAEIAGNRTIICRRAGKWAVVR